MYLSILSAEEKVLFFGLAYNLAVSDGNYSIEEQEKMALYEHEMQMKFDKETMVKPIDVIIEEISKKSSMKVKKIILFEAIGIAMVDNNFDAGERAIVLRMESVFGIQQAFARKCEQIITEYYEFQCRINSLFE